MNINWSEIKDKYCFGESPVGKLWIRVDSNNNVNSLYTMWGDTNKFLPKNEKEETLEGMKSFAEELVKNRIQQLKILNKS
jgi:hypothetical protein